MDVDQSAPVCESDETLIGAAADVVWDAPSDFRSWLLWMPGMESVQVDGPIQAGTEFEWKRDPELFGRRFLRAIGLEASAGRVARSASLRCTSGE